MTAHAKRYSFGDLIRAARLGFRWCDALGAFLRLSDRDAETFFVEVCPPGAFPSKAPTKLHRCWWERENPDFVVTGSPFLSSLGPVTSSACYVIDNDGERVQ